MNKPDYGRLRAHADMLFIDDEAGNVEETNWIYNKDWESFEGLFIATKRAVLFAKIRKVDMGQAYCDLINYKNWLSSQNEAKACQS